MNREKFYPREYVIPWFAKVCKQTLMYFVEHSNFYKHEIKQIGMR